MTKLYVANTTKHIQEFAYRIPEYTKLFQQSIPVGGQLQIYQDSPKDVLEYIVNQHSDTPKPFILSADDAARHRGFVGLIYSFDKPVNANLIEGVFETNDTALKQDGLEIRKESAAAVDAKLTEDGGAGNLSVEVIEQTKPGEDNRGALNEKITVQKGGKHRN